MVQIPRTRVDYRRTSRGLAADVTVTFPGGVTQRFTSIAPVDPSEVVAWHASGGGNGVGFLGSLLKTARKALGGAMKLAGKALPVLTPVIAPALAAVGVPPAIAGPMVAAGSKVLTGAGGLVDVRRAPPRAQPAALAGVVRQFAPIQSSALQKQLLSRANQMAKGGLQFARAAPQPRGPWGMQPAHVARLRRIQQLRSELARLGA